MCTHDGEVCSLLSTADLGENFFRVGERVRHEAYVGLMSIQYVHQKVIEAITGALFAEGTRRDRLKASLSSIQYLSPPGFLCPPEVEPAVSSWLARSKQFTNDPKSLTDEDVDAMLRDLVSLAHQLM